MGVMLLPSIKNATDTRLIMGSDLGVSRTTCADAGAQVDSGSYTTDCSVPLNNLAVGVKESGGGFTHWALGGDLWLNPYEGSRLAFLSQQADCTLTAEASALDIIAHAQVHWDWDGDLPPPMIAAAVPLLRLSTLILTVILTAI